MKAFVFPGQGAQFVGMGKDLYENFPLAKELFEKANDILGYRITDIMFEGTDEDLRQTKVTQPAVFLHFCLGSCWCFVIRRRIETGVCTCHGYAESMRSSAVNHGCHHRIA